MRKAWGDTSERWGGADSIVKVYRVLVQAVLFFGAEPWVLMEPMSQRIEGAHMSLLRQITHKQAMRRRYGSLWHVPA